MPAGVGHGDFRKSPSCDFDLRFAIAEWDPDSDNWKLGNWKLEIRRAATVIVPPAGVNFTALLHQVEKDLLEAHGVGGQYGRPGAISTWIGLLLLVGQPPGDDQEFGSRRPPAHAR